MLAQGPHPGVLRSGRTSERFRARNPFRHVRGGRGTRRWIEVSGDNPQNHALGPSGPARMLSAGTIGLATRNKVASAALRHRRGPTCDTAHCGLIASAIRRGSDHCLTWLASAPNCHSTGPTIHLAQNHQQSRAVVGGARLIRGIKRRPQSAIGGHTPGPSSSIGHTQVSRHCHISAMEG